MWLYLFEMPFAIVGLFGWYTIPGVAIASFFYLGLFAAGEELQQPFGYDPVGILVVFNLKSSDTANRTTYRWIYTVRNTYKKRLTL